MPTKPPAVEIEVDNRVVRISNPDRVYFPESGATKLDLVQYYLAVGDGIVNALFERPCMLHRFPTGLSGEKVHQKRLPQGAPPWVETVRLHFPRWNRTADELCVTELGSVIWAVQMSTVEFHPWNSRREDPEKPDEWRIDLDPGPLSDWAQVRRVTEVTHEVLDELGAVGFPKTSGGKGLHIYVRIRPDHGHKVVRRAALAFAREVERRAPDDVTTAWWRKDRDPAPPVRGLQPERPRPHHRGGVLGARLRRRARVGTGALGGGRRLSSRATSRCTRCPRGTPSSATCTRASTARSSTSRRCWSGPTATSGPARRRPTSPSSREDFRCGRPSRRPEGAAVGADPTGLTFRPATEAEVARGPELFPHLRQGFEALGFRRVGAVVEDLPPEGLDALVEGFDSRTEAGYRTWTGVPSTALVSPDGATLALIGWFWDTPLVELTSILADGRPVSTRSPWQVDPPWPVAIQRYWKYTDRRSEQLYDAMPGRSIEIADGLDPADLRAAHDEHLVRVGGSASPIDTSAYCDMRNVAHEVLWLGTRRVNRGSRALQVAACVIAVVAGCVVGIVTDSGWLGCVAGLVLLVVLLPLSVRLGWVLRKQPRLRAPYPLRTRA